MTLTAFFDRAKYPGWVAIRAALAYHQLDWSLDEELDQEEVGGFQPGKFEGHETGVEIYGWDVEADAELAGDRDAGLEFHWSSSSIEAGFALAMCAGLAILADAVIIDDNLEPVTLEECLKEVRESIDVETGAVPKHQDPYRGKPRFTPEFSRKVTADWHGYFPELSVYKDRWLLKRFGPIVFGLLLEKKSDPTEYYPLFHSHSLLKEHPDISLMTFTALRNKRGIAGDRMTVRSHDEWLVESGPRMRSQLPFRIDRYLKFYDYEKWVFDCMSDLSSHGPDSGHFELLVTLRAYLGLPYEFMLQNGVAIMTKWFNAKIADSPYHKDAVCFHTEGEKYQAFAEEIRAKVASRKKLEEIYQHNLALFKLQKVASDELLPE